MREEKGKFCLLLSFYGLAFTFFQIMPAFLPRYLSKPLTWGDTLDFLTPFGVIPLAYLLSYRAHKISQSLHLSRSIHKIGAKVLLVIGLILYVDGHGMHLSSNAIDRLLQNMKGSELYKANYLFDEIISHFMWDGGVFLISLGLIILAYKLPLNTPFRVNFVLFFLGATAYGFTYTVNGIEGQTVVFTFPASLVGLILALVLYIKDRRNGSHNSCLLFFIISYFISIILFSYWGISHSGFPQFSELGWI